MSHPWRFQRAGGFDQVVIDTADDLRNLATLDQKLWVALACPVVGNELDAATLALVDSDGDGRIRAPELLAAIAWCDGTFKDLGTVLRAQDGLALANIADADVLASARRILEGMGNPEGTEITVSDTAGANKLLDAMPFNGDGVVPASTAVEEDQRAALQDVLDTVGGTPDRNGDLGIDRDRLATFWTALADYEAWWRKAEEDEDTVVPLGAGTAPAVEAFVAVKDKIEDFFTRCELAAFDPRSTAHLVGAEARWDDIGARTLSSADAEIAAFPLAAVQAGRTLPLRDGLNPAWVGAMAAFRDKAVVPLLGELDALDRDQWRGLGSRFAAYEAWLAAKQGAVVESLGIERIRVLLGGMLRARLEDLIERDEARKPEADALQAVDRAARYHRDLYTLVLNFVSFKEFYRPTTRAMFQAGVLYLDGRSCDLVMRVEDVGKHSASASQSYAYLAYCACERKATGEKMSIVAAFTDGDSDFLAVGRNGLLYDRKGNDWDATIVKVVEQPISIRQAFWAPYKGVVRFISAQAEKFASDQDKAAQGNLTAQATQSVEAVKAPPTTAPTTAQSAFDIGKFAGIFAAIGLAMGFMISAVTMLLTGFLSLRLWQMPLALASVMLLISGPSMLLAAFKLRLRNLAPLLDANGWAINARARINIPFGKTLTQVAMLPAGSKRDLSDPYREKGSWVPLIFFGVVVVCGVALAWDLGLKDWLVELSAPPAPVEAPAAATP